MKKMECCKNAGILSFVLILAIAGNSWAQEAAQIATDPVDVLIVDETHTISESFQVAAFAMQLVKAGYSVKGIAEIPLGPNPTLRVYDLIVVIPENVAQVWLITPDLPERIAGDLRAGFLLLEEIAVGVFESGQPIVQREVVDPSEDVVPSLYASLFLKTGWLVRLSH